MNITFAVLNIHKNIEQSALYCRNTRGRFLSNDLFQGGGVMPLTTLDSEAHGGLCMIGQHVKKISSIVVHIVD